MAHISDHDLERHHLGMVEEPELTALEEHYLGCPECAARTEDCAAYVDAMGGDRYGSGMNGPPPTRQAITITAQ